jgi:hypothetical protein
MRHAARPEDGVVASNIRKYLFSDLVLSERGILIQVSVVLLAHFWILFLKVRKMSKDASTEQRLDSWKEIAAHIGRDIRTAIRWEKARGLPVHRVPGKGARDPVFAYRSELDEWLRRGKNGTAPTTEVQADGVTSTEQLHLSGTPEAAGSPKVDRTRSRLIGASSAVLVMLLAVFIFLARRPLPSGLTAKIQFTTAGVQGLDDAGQVIWMHQFSALIHPESLKHMELLNNLVRIADLYGDGRREMLVTVPLERSRNPGDVPLTEVDCFSRDGKLLWSYVPQEKLRFGNYDLDGPWIVEDILLSPSAKPVIWVALAHYRWGNSIVVQLDPATGKSITRFVNTGIVYKLKETRISGKPYLLIGGFNNEYAAGILAAVNEDQPYAVSPQTTGTRHKCLSCPEGVPDYYFVFPRSEINRLLKSWEDSVRFLNVQGNNIEVDKSELGDPALGDQTDIGKVHVVYEFHADPILRPFTVRFDSWYDMMHRDLQSKGKLNHTLESCPERLHPEPVRLWTPGGGWQEFSLPATEAPN